MKVVDNEIDPNLRIEEAVEQFRKGIDEEIALFWREKSAAINELTKLKIQKTQSDWEALARRQLDIIITAAELLKNGPSWPSPVTAVSAAPNEDKNSPLLDAAKTYQRDVLSFADSIFAKNTAEALGKVEEAVVPLGGVGIGSRLSYDEVQAFPKKIDAIAPILASTEQSSVPQGGNPVESDFDRYIWVRISNEVDRLRDSIATMTDTARVLEMIDAEQKRRVRNFAFEIIDQRRKTTDLEKAAGDVMDQLLKSVERPTASFPDRDSSVRAWRRAYRLATVAGNKESKEVRDKIRTIMEERERRFEATWEGINITDIERIADQYTIQFVKKTKKAWRVLYLSEVANRWFETLVASAYRRLFKTDLPSKNIEANRQRDQPRPTYDVTSDLIELRSRINIVTRKELLAAIQAKEAKLREELVAGTQVDSAKAELERSVKDHRQKIYKASCCGLKEKALAFDMRLIQSIHEKRDVVCRRALAELLSIWVDLRPRSLGSICIWLKRQLEGKRDAGGGLSLHDEGVTPERGQGLRELAALGCAALVIVPGGKSAYIAESLLDFVEMGDLAASDRRASGQS